MSVISPPGQKAASSAAVIFSTSPSPVAGVSLFSHGDHPETQRSTTPGVPKLPDPGAGVWVPKEPDPGAGVGVPKEADPGAGVGVPELNCPGDGVTSVKE